MKKIKTVLFDFDGTLANTNRLISESFLYVLNKYFPNQYTHEDVRKFNGPPLEETFQKIMPEKASELVVEYREYNHANHDRLITPFPDVKESLEKLKKHGVKLAVVSTKISPTVKKGLDLLEITDYFDVILGGDDYQNHKPHPESLYMAMDHLNTTPDETIMVGDNWQDIEAGNNANVTSVFVKWSEKTLTEMEPYSPNKVVDSMVELTEWILTNRNGGDSE